MANDPNYKTTPPSLRVYTLHDDTAYDAAGALLDGESLPIAQSNVVWLWFVALGSYDGDVDFEISPDGGVTWFPASGSLDTSFGTFVNGVSSPVDSASYFIYTPSWCQFRARMSGGTQGSLTVYAKMTNLKVAA